MSNPTTYFGWQMPTATDLVTDLPADFEVFGQAVDTDFQDLLGGTTGQILSKTSATDLDFTWINNDQGDITAVTAGTGISGGGTSGAVTITNSMATEITAKADLIVGTGNASFDNLAVGTNGQVLTADSTVSPTGLKWETPSAGGLTWEAFTPTWGNLTVGNGTVVARKATTNDYETLFIQLTFGSTTSVSGLVYVNTPTTGVIDYSFNTGTCAFYDTSADNLFLGIATTGTSGGVQRVNPNALNTSSTYASVATMTSTVPFTWATGDILAINIYYEF